MSVCYKVGRERGAWFELVCLRRTIQLRELSGKDTTFEKDLLKDWLKDPEYKNAVMPDNLSSHFNIGLSPQDKGSIPYLDNSLSPSGKDPPDLDARTGCDGKK